MKLEISKRDEKLLIFLGIFLVVVAMGWFLARPLYNRAAAVRAAADDMEERVAQKQNQILLYAVEEKQLEQTQAACESLAENFHPMLSSEQIDQLITGKAVDNQLKVVSLEIQMPDAAFLSVPYAASERYRKLAQAARDAGEDENSGSQDGGVSETQTPGVYAAGVSLTVSGSQDGLRQFLDDWMNTDPAVRVKSFTWQGSRADGAETDTLSAELAVYMVDLTDTGEKEAD